VDISTAGTGLELLDIDPDQAIGRQVTVAVKLQGTVRNASGNTDEGFRFGLQFVELTTAEQMFLKSVARPQANW
jgi:hypothetical protein